MQHKHMLILAFSATLAGSVVVGCSGNPARQDIGTVSGAVLGGAAGAALTGSTTGTLIGAGAGAFAGNRIGRDFDRKR